MTSADAPAKINIGLVVGPHRADGKHQVVSVLQRLELRDTIELEQLASDAGTVVDGFDDTLVGAALNAFAEATGTAHGWHARIRKRIPVAAGLGGGSSDAATTLRLANELAGGPLADGDLHAIAARLGADVPFFLRPGTQIATGDGTELRPLWLQLDVPVVLVLPADERKDSTATVFSRFDSRRGFEGFEERRAALLAAVAGAVSPTDLASVPANDLASSPLADELRRAGAFRADVSGAGPAVYGLFERDRDAEVAARELASRGETILTRTAEGS